MILDWGLPEKKIALLYTSPSYSYFLISLGFPLSLLVPFSSPGRRQPESTAHLSVLPRNTIQRLSQGSELHCLIYSPVHTWVSCPRIQYSDSVKALNYTFWSRVQCTIYYSIRSRATLLSKKSTCSSLVHILWHLSDGTCHKDRVPDKCNAASLVPSGDNDM